jgi:hypothetical protein
MIVTSWVAVVLGGCTPDPSTDRTDNNSGTESGTSGVTGDTGGTAGTGATGDTGTAETGHTADTGLPTTPSVDPFLAGDPDTIVGQLTLSWPLSEDPPTEWWFTGYTFEAGRFRWTGKVRVAATGLDSCEVRDGDPEMEMALVSAGAIDLHSAAGDLSTTRDGGYYSGAAELADLDPRGLLWQVVGEGDQLPFFDLPAAITFPTGELAVTAPLPGAEVSSAAPLGFAWTGDAAERVEIRLNSGQAQIRCLATDDGAFELDAATLAMLPAGTVSFEVSRINLEGHAIGAKTDWVEVRALQSVKATFTLAP